MTEVYSQDEESKIGWIDYITTYIFMITTQHINNQEVNRLNIVNSSTNCSQFFAVGVKQMAVVLFLLLMIVADFYISGKQIPRNSIPYSTSKLFCQSSCLETLRFSTAIWRIRFFPQRENSGVRPLFLRQTQAFCHFFIM